MRKILINIAIGVCACAVTFATTFFAAVQPLSRGKADAESVVKTNAVEIKELKADISGRKDEIEAAREEFKAAKDEAETAKKEAETAKNDASKAKADAQEQTEAAKAEMDKAKTQTETAKAETVKAKADATNAKAEAANAKAQVESTLKELNTKKTEVNNITAQLKEQKTLLDNSVKKVQKAKEIAVVLKRFDDEMQIAADLLNQFYLALDTGNYYLAEKFADQYDTAAYKLDATYEEVQSLLTEFNSMK